MDPRYQQAAIRFVVALILGAIGAGAANVTILTDTVADPVYATVVEAIAFAVLNFISKAVGGPTVSAPRTVGRTLGAEERPNILSV